MAITTVGNLEEKYGTVVPVYYFLCICVFTVGIVIWREREPFEVLDCSKVKMLPSYFTVKLDPIPEGYSEA